MKQRNDKNAAERAGPSSQQQRLEEHAVRSLEEAFKGDCWRISHPRRGAKRIDLVCKKGGQVYVIDVKSSAGKARRANLQALLADAILQARDYAAHFKGQPLAIVAASSISNDIAQGLGEYARKFGDGIAWGVVDERGRLDLHGPGLDSVQRVKSAGAFESRREYRRASRSDPFNPFSDLGQWMLKILIAPNVPEQWLNAPRDPIVGVADLAERAAVSVASASRLLAGLEQAGHLVQIDKAIRLVRVNELMKRWLAASQQPLRERFARFIIPSSDPTERLRELLAKRSPQRRGANQITDRKRACLALFSACNSLKVGFVRGAPSHIYAEDLSPAFLRELELQPVQHRAESELIVRQPRFPESVFRARVRVEDVPVADLLQCWLDLSLHPVRGAEQTEQIEERLHMAEWDQ